MDRARGFNDTGSISANALEYLIHFYFYIFLHGEGKHCVEICTFTNTFWEMCVYVPALVYHDGKRSESISFNRSTLPFQLQDNDVLLFFKTFIPKLLIVQINYYLYSIITRPLNLFGTILNVLKKPNRFDCYRLLCSKTFKLR